MRMLLVAVLLVVAGPARPALFSQSFGDFASALLLRFRQVADAQHLDKKSAALAKRTVTAWFYMYRCGGVPADLPGVNARDVFETVLGTDVKNPYSAAVLEMLGVLEVANAGFEKPLGDLCRFAREAAVLPLPK